MAYYDDLHVGRYVRSRLRTSEVRYASYAQRYVGAVHVDNEEFDAALPSSSPGIKLAWRSGGQPIALNASATIVVLIYIAHHSHYRR